jgi:TP901 family phage tail tape measure protein
MADPNLEVVVSAQDRITLMLSELGKKLEGLVPAAAKVSHETKELEHPGVWQRLSEHAENVRGKFGELAEKVAGVGERIVDLLPMLAGLGGVGSIGGLAEMARQTAELGEHLHNLSVETGVTTQALQALQFGAEQAGLSGTNMQMGLDRLNRTIADSASGRNKQAASLFAHLGISLRDAHGHIRSVTEILPLLADAIQKTASAAMRSDMAQTLMGRSGARLLPLFAEGSAGLDELQERWNRFGYTLSDAQVATSTKFMDSWHDMTAAVSGFSTEVGARLLGVLQPVIEKMADWIATNREWLAQDITGAVRAAAGAFQVALDAIDPVIAAIGGLVEWVRPLAPVLNALVPPLIAFGGALGVLFIAGKIRETAIAVQEFGEAMRAVVVGNPILMLAAVIGVAAFEIYEHWDWIRRQLGPAWAAIAAAAQALETRLAPVWRAIGEAGQVVAAGWQRVEPVLAVIWSEVSEAIVASWAVVQPVIARIGAIAEALMQEWQPAGDFFRTLWDGIVDSFEAAWERIRPVLALVGGAVGTVTRAVGAVGRFLGLGDGRPATPVPAVAASGPALRMPSLPRAPASAPQFPPFPGAPVAGGRAAGSLSTASAGSQPSGDSDQPKTGRVDVHVHFTGAPPGTRVRTEASGIAAPAETNVGYSYPMGPT